MAKSKIPFKIYRALALQGNDILNEETLGDAKTLLLSDAQFQNLDPGGANRDITLPAEELSKGLFFVIANKADAAENLVIKNDATSTICTANQNEVAVVLCTGSAWKVIGVFSAQLT